MAIKILKNSSGKILVNSDNKIVVGGSTSSYTITPTVTNVTIDPLTASIVSGGSTTFTVTADGSSYKLPTTITVEGTTVTAGVETTIPNKSTVLFTRTSDTAGTIAFSNVTDDVAFSVVGESIIEVVHSDQCSFYLSFIDATGQGVSNCSVETNYVVFGPSSASGFCGCDGITPHVDAVIDSIYHNTDYYSYTPYLNEYPVTNNREIIYLNNIFVQTPSEDLSAETETETSIVYLGSFPIINDLEVPYFIDVPHGALESGDELAGMAWYDELGESTSSQYNPCLTLEITTIHSAMEFNRPITVSIQNLDLEPTSVIVNGGEVEFSYENNTVSFITSNAGAYQIIFNVIRAITTTVTETLSFTNLNTIIKTGASFNFDDPSLLVSFVSLHLGSLGDFRETMANVAYEKTYPGQRTLYCHGNQNIIYATYSCNNQEIEVAETSNCSYSFWLR